MAIWSWAISALIVGMGLIRAAHAVRVRRRCRAQPHATYLGHGTVLPWGSLLAALGVAGSVTWDAPPNARLIGVVIWSVYGLGTLARWAAGTWIHGGGVELLFGLQPWQRISACRVETNEGKPMLLVEFGLGAGKLVSHRQKLTPARAESARVALALLGRGDGLPSA